ncbi:MAG TPA: hypothetical protein VLG39_09680 [Nitrospirota bacterium]|nr:hypothetical protein [Nitrospirota bacterium]
MIKKTFSMPLLPALLLSTAFFLVSTAGAQQAQGLDPSAYRLVGTIMADGLIGAVLVDAKGEQTFYRLHDQLQDGSKLVGVHSDSILVERGDKTVYEIFIAHDTKSAVPQAGPPPSAGRVVPEAASEGADRKEPQRQRRGRIRNQSLEE